MTSICSFVPSAKTASRSVNSTTSPFCRRNRHGRLKSSFAIVPYKYIWLWKKYLCEKSISVILLWIRAFTCTTFSGNTVSMVSVRWWLKITRFAFLDISNVKSIPTRNRKMLRFNHRKNNLRIILRFFVCPSGTYNVHAKLFIFLNEILSFRNASDY